MKSSFPLRISAALLALCLAGVVLAAGTSATLTWTHPTTRIDGSALPVGQIKETLIEWRRPGNTTVVGSVRVNAPATTTVVTGLVCGNFNFVAYTIATDDAQSDATNPVAYATAISCKPNPPTGLGAN